MITKPVIESKKDIPNEDFECNPKGECWCKEEEFPPLPPSDICFSPREIDRFKSIDIKQFAKHLRNRIYHNYGDYFIGRTPDEEQLTTYIEEYLVGKIDKTKDLYFEEYDEWKLNRGLQDE